jgi:large subunit ribosomal protein L18
MYSVIRRKECRRYRHERVRRKISGTAEVPRLSVYISGKHIYIQVINDLAQHTLVSASTIEKAHQQQGLKTNCESAAILGKLIAERSLALGIKKIVFDRGGFKYHGRVKSIADHARSAGIEF